MAGCYEMGLNWFKLIYKTAVHLSNVNIQLNWFRDKIHRVKIKVKNIFSNL